MTSFFALKMVSQSSDYPLQVASGDAVSYH